VLEQREGRRRPRRAAQQRERRDHRHATQQEIGPTIVTHDLILKSATRRLPSGWPSTPAGSTDSQRNSTPRKQRASGGGLKPAATLAARMLAVRMFGAAYIGGAYVGAAYWCWRCVSVSARH